MGHGAPLDGVALYYIMWRGMILWRVAFGRRDMIFMILWRGAFGRRGIILCGVAWHDTMARGLWLA